MNDDVQNATENPEETEAVETATCSDCEDNFAVSELESVEISAGYSRLTTTHLLCSSCREDTQRCNDCGRLEIDDSEMTLIRDNWLCVRCVEHYSRCHVCGVWLHCDDVRTDAEGDGEYCVDCEPEREEKSSDDRINDYLYKPRPRFFGQGPLFFGAELEVNCSDTEEAVDWFLAELGEDHVYLKEDGSLSSGFEIVSHPHSFTEAIALWRKVSQDAPATSFKSGECGFHVHVSRKALTPLQIQKIVVFINAPENYDFVCYIAQRTSNQYSAVKNKQIGRCRRSGDRYEAVNLENSETIEFRIFRGTLKPERLLKNLEFCHAVIQWVQTVSYRELTHARFEKYVADNRKQYKNLHQYLKDRNKTEETRCA